MKNLRSIILGVLVSASCGSLFASPRSDSLLAFTGATRVKAAMRTFPWCSNNYQPRATYNQAIYGYDTQTDKTWVILAETAAGCAYARIDRSGKWVAYSKLDQKGVYVRSMDDTTVAERKVIDGSNFAGWWTGAFHYDAVTAKEYLYTLNCTTGWGGVDGKIYKIPFSVANGTVDLSSATTLTVPGSSQLDNAISVSQDGTKIGCAYPWPNTKIFDVTGNRLYDKHNGTFGCQANLAPDNSYYFFHCRDDHGGVNMFTGALTDQAFTAIDFTQNLVGGLPAGSTMTFRDPRWSNHLRFVSNVYPMDEGGYLEDPYSGQLGGTADWVQNSMIICRKPSSVLEKLSADGKSVEGSIYVAFDRRRFDLNLETWLDNGVTTGNSTVTASPSVTSDGVRGQIRVVQSNRQVQVSASAGGRLVVRILDARGRIVAQGSGVGGACLDTRSLQPGMYVVAVAGSTAIAARQLTISK